ncbi:MAG TPA: DUF389 domain-containing protein [Sphingomonadaceae bacterium]|nr:DUF389 domain-containing protein [Sphingomonadaceae bacterium]
MAETDAVPPQSPREQGFAHVIGSLQSWWQASVVGTVKQVEVIEKRRDECHMSARYIFMLAMSACIAMLGLLLSSPAVVIGAMLLSPLMGPIIGLGFALATGDYPWMRQAAISLAYGTAIAVLLTALLVVLSPYQTVTPEIAARTRPNLFDLGVAFFSALAGAYAMIRGSEGTVVGVAIATALMPPLAVVGFGLATWNGAVFWGALFLYVTNLLTIALTAWLMAKLYGFRSRFSERQTLFQSIAIIAVFVGLAVPLFFSLNQIVWETRSTQKIRNEILDVFVTRSVIDNLDINYDADPIRISATVFTPERNPDAETAAARAIVREIQRPVEVALIQSLVGQDKNAAEAAQLAAARASQEAADRQRSEALAVRLSLVAGVQPSDVMIDRERRRALVKAQPLEGASLRAYRELERRIAATEPEWQIRLEPPARPLPDVLFENGRPTAQGQEALGLIVWAAERVDVPLVLTGDSENTTRLAALLAEREIASRSMVTVPTGNRVQVSWGAPGE